MFSVGAGYTTAHAEVIHEVTNMCILTHVGQICGAEGGGGCYLCRSFGSPLTGLGKDIII